MDTGVRVTLVLAALGAVQALCASLLGEELKQLSRYARISLAISGTIFFLGAALTFLFWPDTKTGRGPRLEVLQPIVIVPPTGGKPGYFNVHYKNTGDRPATGGTGRVLATKPHFPRALTAAEEDVAYADLANGFDQKMMADNDIQPGDDQKWFTAFWKDVSQKDWEENLAGRGWPIYLMIYAPYKDGADQIVTQYCSYFIGGVQHDCHGHNHIGPMNK